MGGMPQVEAAVKVQAQGPQVPDKRPAVPLDEPSAQAVEPDQLIRWQFDDGPHPKTLSYDVITCPCCQGFKRPRAVGKLSIPF